MHKSKNSKGFTLIEILLATFILVMVGVAAIGVERNFMGSAGVNKHKLQATALAQEGISAARSDYNTRLLDTAGLLGPFQTGCYVVAGNNFQFRSSNTSDPSCIDSGLNLRLNNVQFTRTIIVP